VNLDDDLRRLFTEQGDRLDVAVRADAEDVIVAGARRVRRRRRVAAGAGAIAAVAVVATGLALATGHQDAMPPAVTVTTTPPPLSTGATSPSSVTGSVIPPAQPPPESGTRLNTRTNEPPADTEPEEPADPPPLSLQVLGPQGIGGAQLGQPLAAAQASGMLGPMILDGAGGGCDQYQLLVSGADPNFVYVSPSGAEQTVQAFVSVNVQTPEGVGPGWTIAQVKAVYSDLDEQQARDFGSSLVSTPGTGQSNYRFIFTPDGTVARVILQTIDQPCY
jgi:hypothetical protein